MKKICIFCMKNHREPRPDLCKAKGDVLRAYMKQGKLEFWQVLFGVERGLLPLEADAKALVAKRRKRRKRA